MIEVLLNSYPSDKHKIKKKNPLYIPLSFTEYTTSMDYDSTNSGSTTIYYSPTYTVRRT